jgi:hypothetical protein
VSNRYVLRQSYEITNISGQEITGLQAFQFLHGLECTRAIYDNRDYGGTFGSYQYDITQRGTSTYYDWNTGEEHEIEDLVAFHSSLEPTAWEVGFFGQETIDDHAWGKPSVGVHLSVENNSLNGTDFFDPPPPNELWVSGAQRYNLGALLPGASVTFDVLLSIRTYGHRLSVCVDDGNSGGLEYGTAEYPFNTLQEAVDVAADGSTIKLAQGTYSGGLQITDKQVTIMGGYPGGTYPGVGDFRDTNRNPDPETNQTVLNGGGAPFEIACQGQAAKGSVLDGLSIRNGGAMLSGGVVLKGVIATSGP